MNKIDLDHFCKLSYVSHLSASPERDKLCFLKSSADLKENKYFKNIWLYETGKAPRQLTTSNKDNRVHWLDENTILFSSGRDQDPKKPGTAYYTLNVNGGEAQQLFKTCHEISKCVPIDSQNFLILFNYHPELFELQQNQDTEAILKFIEDNNSWEVIDEVPFWSNGGSYTSKQRSVLAIFNIETLKAEILVDKLTDVDLFELSPDHSKVLYIGSSYKDLQSLYNGLFILDLHTRKKEELMPEETYSYDYAKWLDNESVLYFGKDGKTYGMNENGKFYKYSMLAHEKNCLTPELDAGFYSSMGSDAKYGSSGFSEVQALGEKLCFISTNGNSSNIFAISPENTCVPVTAYDGAVMEFAVMKDELVFSALLNAQPMELFSLSEGVTKPLSDFNKTVNETHFLSVPETFSSISQDGTVIDGWVIRPMDFNSARRYPTILNIHGGPKTIYGSVYYHEMQYWAQEGFVVIYCNPRGSDGRGNAFADIRGKYGSIDYSDIMSFVDTAIEKYDFIDSNRLGVTGGSYGGFMTNWIVGHTDRFKAAATQRSIANWVSMFGTTDIGYFFTPDQIGADPWTNIEKVWDLSPLKYANQVKTPLLVLHSEQDYRCWVTEGYQMFTAMKYNGVPSKMVMFKGENHELSRSGKPKNRVKRLKEITEWMKLYL